ncbi:MAG TPA: hypothetical protein VJO12_08400 [Stellaceae bacterium]|nr:hypothetical protein [Stellaceae bacterium]
MPDSEITAIAPALIATHGPEAVAAAERALGNVRRLGMDERARWWERVVSAVKEMEAARR